MGWWVAHKILETTQSLNSSFPFLFDLGLGLRLVNLKILNTILLLLKFAFKLNGFALCKDD